MLHSSKPGVLFNHFLRSLSQDDVNDLMSSREAINDGISVPTNNSHSASLVIHSLSTFTSQTHSLAEQISQNLRRGVRHVVQNPSLNPERFLTPTTSKLKDATKNVALPPAFSHPRMCVFKSDNQSNCKS